MKVFDIKLLSSLILFLTAVPTLHSTSIEDSLGENILNVYIDCEHCDKRFIKTEIQFVNYVIDRSVADIHVLILTQSIASGGAEYTIVFIGQRDYKGMEDTLKFIAGRSDTEDIIRRGIVKLLKIGFMRYVAKTTVADKISISFAKEEKKPLPVVDRWKNWVFSISANCWLHGEQQRTYNQMYGSVDANRVTEEWKIRFSIYRDYRESIFRINDTTTIYTISKGYGSSGSVVKSMGDYWSSCVYMSFRSSTYDNTKADLEFSPIIEYSIFPYTQSTHRALRIKYSASYADIQYYEETIFDKMHENLFNESVSITLDIKQRWGSVRTTLEGSHYFHDFTKNHLSLSNTLSFPITKGLSLRINGYLAMIHDQLSLPKRGLTPEEAMLQIKQLATQYNYWVSVGLSYSFGSIYSSVVNPRMEEGWSSFISF